MRLVQRHSDDWLTELRSFVAALDARDLVRRDLSYDELAGMIGGPTQLLEARTLDAYRQIAEDVRHYDASFTQIMSTMDALQDLMDRSRVAIEGNIRAVSEVQAQCNQIIQSDAMLDRLRAIECRLFEFEMRDRTG